MGERVETAGAIDESLVQGAAKVAYVGLMQKQPYHPNLLATLLPQVHQDVKKTPISEPST